jgi:hypothetical protein
MLGDKTMEAKGNVQENLGNVQAKLVDIEKDLKVSSK